MPTEDGYVVTPGEVESPTRATIDAAPEGRFFYAITFAPYADLPSEPPRRDFYEAEGRRLWIGGNSIARCDLVVADADAKIRLNLSGLAPWQAYDSLALVSQSAEFWHEAMAGDGAAGEPEAGATSIEGWELELAALGSSYGADPYRVEASDDLVLFQQAEGFLDATTEPTDPWLDVAIYETVAAVDLAGATLGDGVAEITGEMAPLPVEEFQLDLRTTAFSELIEERLPGVSTRVTVRGNVEPASSEGELYFGVNPTLWSIDTAYTNTDPVDPACYPWDGSTCPECFGACNESRHFIRPGDLQTTIRYGNPFAGRMTEMVNVNIDYIISGRDPRTDELEYLWGALDSLRPAAEANGAPFEPRLGLPGVVHVNGVELPPDVLLQDVGTMPVLSFAAPSLGAPDFYAVEIVDTTDVTYGDGDRSTSRVAARITTRSTEVRIPDGVLLDGRWYWVRVSAMQFGGSLSEPALYPTTRYDRTQMFSGLLTP